MSTPYGANAPRPAARLSRRQVALIFCVGLVSLPFLMGQNSCFLRSPVASKKKSYGQNAQQLYKYARQLLKGGNFQEARTAFQRIKTKYPFSAFATLADLGIGDAYFKAGKYLRAVDIYKLFTKLHPTHPQAGYAAFMVGEGYEKLRPWEWFLVPASHERDATHTRQAIQAFREFLKRFPKHKLAPKAQKKLLFSLNLLAKHELYVANFYRRKGQHRAVLWRMQYLLEKYPKVKLAAEARFRKAESLQHLKKYKEAHEAFLAVVKHHPKSNFARDAKGRANSLLPKIKTKTPAPKRPAARRAAPVRRAPAPVRKAPAPVRRAPAPRPAARPAAPAARPAAPAPRRDAPAARREPPAARRDAPAVRRDAPTARREAVKEPKAAPAARRESPASQPANRRPAAR